MNTVVLKKFLSNRLLYFGLSLIIFVSVIFYLVLMRQAKSTVINQVLHQQQTVARAENSNITSFFQVFGDSLSILAQLDSISLRNESTVHDMDAFVEQWRSSGIIGGVILTDSRGIVQFNSNVIGTRDIGASLADREYFVWAKTVAKAGEYFIGQPVISKLGASKGQTIVPVAAPIFVNGVFSGAMAASIELKPLTDNYLGLMKVTDKTDVVLIDQTGKILYITPVTELTGSTVDEYLKLHPSLGNTKIAENLKTSFESGQETSFQATYFDPKNKKVQDHLIVFSPIILGNQKWMLAMGSPLDQVTELTRPIYIRQLSVLVLIILCAITFRIAVVISNRDQKRL